MISICIPIYNFDVKNLVLDLLEQAKKLGVDFEILLIDDFSDNSFRERNATLSNISESVKYIELQKNIGRSAIRNLLAKESKFQYLIFMDCDSKISENNYLKNYIDNCKKDIVVFGGRKYLSTTPQDDTFFRWKYGINSECKIASERSKNPYQSFMTNNFLIDKDIILNKIQFNENLVGYGHEDTLFGIELFKSNIAIKHIDNVLYHIGLENKEDFLEKTTKGIENLAFIYKNNLVEKHLIEKHVKLVRIYTRYKNLYFSFLNKHLSSLFYFLIKKTDSIVFFNLYKLFYFSEVIRKR
jgi:hypothetical protein